MAKILLIANFNYPVPWLDALFIKLVLGMSSGGSWLLTITAVYISLFDISDINI